MTSPQTNLQNINVCIIARKRLKNNTRVIRQAGALAKVGANVTVISLENPITEYLQNYSSVRFIEVKIKPWPTMILQTFNKIVRLFKSAWIYLLVYTGVEDKSRLEMKKRKGSINRTNSILSTFMRKHLAPYSNLALTIQFSRNVEKTLGKEQFDYCQAHDSYALSATWRLANKTGGKIIYDAVEAPDERSGNALSSTPAWLRNIESVRDEKIIQKASRVFSIGESLADWTANRYKIEKPIVIRNCSLYSETEAKDSVKKFLGLNDEDKLGIVVGSIYEGQGLEQLLKSLEYLNKNYHVAVIGPVSKTRYESHIMNIVKNRKFQNRFHVIPPRKQTEIIDFISDADLGLILLQPDKLNHRLALPNKLFEYIMARLPIVSGNIKDVKTIIDKYKNGLCCDERNPEDIAKAMKNLCNDAAYKSRVNKTAKILCWEEEVIKYLQVLDAHSKKREKLSI